MDHYDYDPGRSFDRRIGQRAETDAVVVEWVLPAAGLLRNERSHPGRVEQVSLTGAAVSGPAAMRAKVGDTVLLRHQGADSSVIIRRADPTDDPDVSRYGVELVVVHPLLQAELYPGQARPPAAVPRSPEGAVPDVDGPTDDVAGSAPSAFSDAWGEELQLPERVVEEAPVVADDPGPSPVEPRTRTGAGTSAADAGEVQDLVDELRRFMDD
jgi:hypothetical protein